MTFLHESFIGLVLSSSNSIFSQRGTIMSNAITRHISGPVHSRIVEYNGLVFIAGTTADDRTVGCKEQTEEILKKIDGFLAIVGTSKACLLSATVWLTDIREKEEMNAAWKAWVDPDNKPARACVESRLETPNTRVEIMVTAAKYQGT